MVRAGAIGYLIKGSAPGEIIAAIHGSVRGESNLSPEVTGKVMQELARSLARAEELSTELVELNRMKTELVQILAHELFKPITTIQGTAATLAVSEGRLRATTCAPSPAVSSERPGDFDGWSRTSVRW